MKKHFLFIIFIAAGITASAQKPLKGDKGFVFGVSGVQGLHLTTASMPTGSLGFRYMASDQLMVRGGIRYGYSKSISHSDTTGNGIDTTKTLRSSLRAVNFGFQYSLAKTPKLDPYVGAEFAFTLRNSSREETAQVISTTTPGAIIGDVSQLTANNVGKTSTYGLHAFAGCNYFFSDHIAIGAEFGYGLDYSKLKNGSASIKRTGSTFGPAGTTVITNSAHSTETGIDTNGSGMITVSVFF